MPNFHPHIPFSTQANNKIIYRLIIPLLECFETNPINQQYYIPGSSFSAVLNHLFNTRKCYLFWANKNLNFFCFRHVKATENDFVCKRNLFSCSNESLGAVNKKQRVETRAKGEWGQEENSTRYFTFFYLIFDPFPRARSDNVVDRLCKIDYVLILHFFLAYLRFHKNFSCRQRRARAMICQFHLRQIFLYANPVIIHTQIRVSFGWGFQKWFHIKFSQKNLKLTPAE